MKVTLGNQTRDLAQYVEVSPTRTGQTFNDRHRGILLFGRPHFISAVHWFADQAVFATGSVTRSRQEGKRLKLIEVEAQLVLDVTGELPCGELTREMQFPELMNTIALSFGCPIAPKPGVPAMYFHTESPCDPGSMAINAPRGSELFIQGVMSPEKGTCKFLWAFSKRRYLDWYESKD